MLRFHSQNPSKSKSVWHAICDDAISTESAEAEEVECNIEQISVLATGKTGFRAVSECTQKVPLNNGIDRSEKWDLNSDLNNSGLKYG